MARTKVNEFLRKRLAKMSEEKAALVESLENKQKTNESLLKSNEALHNRNLHLAKRLADELEFSAQTIRRQI